MPPESELQKPDVSALTGFQERSLGRFSEAPISCFTPTAWSSVEESGRFLPSAQPLRFALGTPTGAEQLAGAVRAAQRGPGDRGDSANPGAGILHPCRIRSQFRLFLSPPELKGGPRVSHHNR